MLKCKMSASVRRCRHADRVLKEKLIYIDPIGVLLCTATVGEVRAVERRQCKVKTYLYCTNTYGNTHTHTGYNSQWENPLIPKLYSSADIVSHHPSPINICVDVSCVVKIEYQWLWGVLRMRKVCKHRKVTKCTCLKQSGNQMTISSDRIMNDCTNGGHRLIKQYTLEATLTWEKIIQLVKEKITLILMTCTFLTLTSNRCCLIMIFL